MKEHANLLVSCLIFPIAPIAVIYLVAVLCKDIWQASYYTPGEDGGEFEPAMAIFGIPLLLVVSALLLAGLTLLTRRIEARYAPGVWWRTLSGTLRIAVAAGALILFLAAAAFFMGDSAAASSHWQVVVAWLAWGFCAGAFAVQQYRRVRY